MRKFWIYLLYITAILVVFFSFLYSNYSGDWQWFRRSGGILTVFIILANLITLDKEKVYMQEHNFARYAPSNIEEEIKRFKPIKIIIDSILIIIGTLIQSYGDLIGNFSINLSF